jgi:hypothetical protein
MSDLIASAIRAALEPEIRRIAEEVVKATLASSQTPAARPTWATPPRAAQLLDVPVKRVRAAVARGKVQTRSRSLDPSSAKQQKLEVHIHSLEVALAGEQQKPAELIDAKVWAARRATRKAGAT